MKRKTKIIVYTTCIIMTLLLLLGFTYGYFITKIKGNDNKKSVHIVSGDSSILYTDLSTTEINDLIEPGYTITKLFTIKNTGNVDAKYSIYLTDVVNNFERKQDVTYTLYRKVGNNTITETNLDSCEIIVKDKEFPSTKSVIKADEIISTSTLYYSYALKITYINHPTESQNVDQGKKFSGKVQIYASSSEDLTNPFSEGTLSYTILNNAITAKNTNDTSKTIYSETSKTKPAEEISTETEKTLSIATDDYGNSYYFRGNVIDNYVDFAGMCWRVVRVAGDGSIKLILEDQDSTCATSDGNWNIPTETGGTTKTGNFGYTEYATGTLTASDETTNSSVTYLISYLNGGTNNDKSMATAFKNFQTGPLANYLDKLKTGDWCLSDKAYATSSDNTTALTNQEMIDKQVKRITFYYDSYVRLYGKTTKEPTLKCNGISMNKFADNTDMYVGTLTVDEIIYVGGKVAITNPNYYLINDYQKANELYFLSLSPYRLVGDEDYTFFVGYNGYVDGNAVYEDFALRPAVSLKYNVQINAGDGTIENPYTIKTS